MILINFQWTGNYFSEMLKQQATKKLFKENEPQWIVISISNDTTNILGDSRRQSVIMSCHIIADAPTPAQPPDSGSKIQNISGTRNQYFCCRSESEKRMIQYSKPTTFTSNLKVSKYSKLENSAVTGSERRQRRRFGTIVIRKLGVVINFPEKKFSTWISDNVVVSSRFRKFRSPKKIQDSKLELLHL